MAVWCSTLEPVSFEAGRAAVAAMRGTDEWMPSHARFIAAAQAEGRRIAALRATERSAGAPALYEPITPPEVVRDIFTWIRSAEFKSMSQEQRRDRFEEVYAESVLSHETPYVVPTYTCSRCLDERWIEIGHTDTPTMAPCPQCRHEAFEYQMAGHLRGDHNPAGCSHERCQRRAKKAGRAA